MFNKLIITLMLITSPLVAFEDCKPLDSYHNLQESKCYIVNDPLIVQVNNPDQEMDLVVYEHNKQLISVVFAEKIPYVQNLRDRPYIAHTGHSFQILYSHSYMTKDQFNEDRKRHVFVFGGVAK